ncbi:hypothetical protein IQ07DRAFT_640884 [Pyrenochaeta sp. DS3sAY3a]|nr:hypothetical protein IQ07DRAFT_640884 [Pyrenochaeta sp. DS3sAY3a]
MAALGIALNVFGLFAGGIIGIVDLLLPAETPLYISDLAKGHSLLRIGIGLNGESPQSFGGTIPSIKVFNEEKVQIGQANSDHLTYVENGTFTTVTVYHEHPYLFQQPTYVEVAGGDDAVCIAYLAQTWADGVQVGWLGDMGRFCGAKWYYSNLLVNTKNGTMYKPYCTWIGGQRTSSCASRRKREYVIPSPDANSTTQTYTQNCTSELSDPLFTYSGFKIHSPDFGPVGTSSDFTVPDNPRVLCDFPSLEWFRSQRFTTGAGMRLSPFGGLRFAVSRVMGVLSLLSPRAAAASIKTMLPRNLPYTPPSKAQPSPQTPLQRKLIASHDPQHSSTALCSDPMSYGPDFVSFDEGVYCDMQRKKTWPLCSEEKGVVTGCFEWEGRRVVEGWAGGLGLGLGRRKRGVEYAEVEVWR